MPAANPVPISPCMPLFMIALPYPATDVPRPLQESCKASGPPITARAASIIDDAALNHLTRVENTGRIQRLLDGTHERELDGCLVSREYFTLELADTMFGANGAIEPVHLVVDKLADISLHSLQTGIFPTVSRSHVVVKVAIAQVAEHHMLNTRKVFLQSSIGAGNELGNS